MIPWRPGRFVYRILSDWGAVLKPVFCGAFEIHSRREAARPLTSAKGSKQPIKIGRSPLDQFVRPPGWAVVCCCVSNPE